MKIYVVCDGYRKDAMRKLASKYNLKLIGDDITTREFFEKDYRAARRDPGSTEPKIRGEVQTHQLWPVEDDVDIHFTEFSGGNLFYRTEAIGTGVEVYLFSRDDSGKAKFELVKIIELPKD